MERALEAIIRRNVCLGPTPGPSFHSQPRLGDSRLIYAANFRHNGRFLTDSSVIADLDSTRLQELQAHEILKSQAVLLSLVAIMVLCSIMKRT